MRPLTTALSTLARAGLAGLSGVFEESEADMARQDSWQNVAMGFGTSRDKTQGTNFGGPCIPLTDQECADLFGFDDIAGKIASALPKEAFREGFTLTGLPPEQVKAAADYLEGFQLLQQFKSDAIWGRVFGGCATWIHADDGKRPEEPLDLTAIRTIWKLITCDKRFLIPYRYYTEGPKVAEPELYMLYMPSAQNVLQVAGLIHESRVVVWPGDMTEARAKIQRNGWDYSVLQKPYDALRSSGNTWKAIEILTTDANQAVYKIKNLWRMIASDPTQGEDSKTGNGTPSGALLLRLRFMDLARSVSKAIVLDADGEDFERKATSFSGLADLSDRAWNRVAAAADMPVTILTGQAPAGLNATGASDLRWWYGRVSSEQVQTYEPRIKRVLQVLLSAQDSGIKLDEQAFKAVTIGWKPLWAPSAAELAQMQLQWAQTGQVMIQEQMITPEEYVLSSPEDWFGALDREQRKTMVEELDVQGQKDEAAQAEADAQAAQTEALRAKAGGASGGTPKGRTAGRKDGDPDQPRDELGRWTDGSGSGSSGGRSDPREQARRTRLHARAQIRLSQAKARHEKVKAEHESAKGSAEVAKEVARSKLAARVAEREHAAKQAHELANEAQAKHDAIKAEAKQIAAKMRKIPKDEDGFAKPEHAEAYDALDQHRDKLLAQADELKEHVTDLRREARRNGPHQKIEQVRAAIEAGDGDTLNKLESRDEDANAPALRGNTEAQRRYRQENRGEAPGPEDTLTGDAMVRWFSERNAKYGFPDLTDTKHARTAAKLARAARAVRVHEREVARRGRNDGDPDQPRDEAGRRTDGGGGSAGGSGRSKPAIHSSAQYTGPTRITVYRAANDDYVNPDSTSFAEKRSSAEAYLDNPGHGGSNLYTAEISIDPDRALDLTDLDEDEANEIARDLAGGGDRGAIGTDELIPRISSGLQDAGVDWVRVRESYPENTRTWIYVGPSDTEPEMREVE